MQVSNNMQCELYCIMAGVRACSQVEAGISESNRDGRVVHLITNNNLNHSHEVA